MAETIESLTAELNKEKRKYNKLEKIHEQLLAALKEHEANPENVVKENKELKRRNEALEVAAAEGVELKKQMRTGK